jgi:hypothetical protein
MNVQISDYPAGGVSLSVDWIKVMPYATPGTFESKVFDAASLKNWGNISWTSQAPAGTALAISVREGNTPIPDASWTNYAVIAASGSSVGGTSRYIQYKADLSTSSSNLTPVLNDISINCSSSSNQAPLVTVQPSPQTVCIGPAVVFVSKATGSPTPAAQWQESTDNGGSWNNINGAIADTLRFVPAASDNNKQYRCVWTNSEGLANSNAATLLVNPIPGAAISAVNASICQGDSIRLQLNSTGVNQPYNIVVNGVGYSGVQAGQVIAFSGAIEKSIWGNTGTPTSPAVTDNQPIEIGVKFQSAVSGYIHGVRFYKGTANTGTHVGSLWTTGGTLLATATFTNESASGWQEVHFSAPVAIQANTTYIASYFSQGGYFAISPGFFSGTAVTNAPLTALKAGSDGPNGVYRYGGGFPNGGNTANYWVDVLFESTYTTAQSFNYGLTTVTDTNGCSATGSPLSSASVVINPMPMGALAAPAHSCAGDSIQLTYNASSGVGPYTLTINGATYSDISSGVPFNTGVLPATGSASATVWDNTAIGGEPTAIDSDDIELGMKFRSNISGQVTGVRFYKRVSNTGTHIGTLWSSAGVPLATATFTNETASGWQQVSFSSPVNITANTTYVISYHAPKGNYAFTTHFFTGAGLTNGPLTALQSGVDGNNGVYKYGSGAIYPDQSFNDANYWVDVVFSSVGSNNFTLTNIADVTGCASSGSPISTIITSTANPNSDTFHLSSCNPADTGTVVQHFSNMYGCDSARTIITTLSPSSAATVYLSSCNPADTGVVVLHFSNMYGCDSAHTIITTLSPSSAATVYLSSCNPADTGVVVLHFSNMYGCDSARTIVTTLSPSSATTVYLSSCNPADTGVQVQHFSNMYGCDSARTIVTTLISTLSSTTTASICAGSSYLFNGVSHSTTGTFTAILAGRNGCDSVATLNLTVLPTGISTIAYQTSCNPADTGFIVLHFSNTYGCDSTHTIVTSLLPVSSTIAYQASCNTADTGVVVLHLVNIYGCDSIHTIITTLLPASAPTISYRTSCNVADTGSVIQHYNNIYGCDSVHETITTLLPTSVTTAYLTSCNPSDTGIVVLHLANIYGCDSIHTIITTLLPASGSTVYQTSCNPADTGVVVLHFNNSYGCDSTRTIITTLSGTAVVIIQNHDTLIVSPGVSYQWYLNNTLLNGATDSILVITQSGTYVAQVTNSNGCRNSDTITVTNVGIKDISGQWDIKLYPNPNQGVFTLECNYTLYTAAKITDALGRDIMDLDLRENRTWINASAFADGVYFLNIYDGKQYRSIRFIIAR